MANNYTSLSFTVTCTEPEGKLLLAIAERMEEETEEPDYDGDYNACFLVDYEGDCLWFRHDESASPDDIATVVQEWLALPEVSVKSVGFSWADTCSKARPDEFGGGAVFITADNIDWQNTYYWLQQKEQELAKV